MTRRLAAIDDEPQLELPLGAAARRKPAVDDKEVELQLRVPTEVAKAIAAAAPGAVVEFFKTEVKRMLPGTSSPEPTAHTADKEGSIGLTNWLMDEPPCFGFWEIKQKAAREPESVRWWFDKDKRMWRNPAPYQTSAEGRLQTIAHDEFVKSNVWRGLREHFGKYTYDLATGGASTTARQKMAGILLSRRKAEL